MTTALILIDMQTQVMSTCPAAEPVIAVVNRLIAEARQSGTPVACVQHHDADLPIGSDAWQLDARLDSHETDLLVEKTFRDGFAETALDAVLQQAGVRRLVITGAHSDFCVQSTALSALAHGYDMTLVQDGHAAEPSTISGIRLDAATISEFVNARMSTLRHPGRNISVLPAGEVNFGQYC